MPSSSNARAKVAKAEVEQRRAELLAQAEAQLAAQYRVDDEAWDEVTSAAEQVVREADEEVAARCRKLGIPEQFRPGFRLFWSGRGDNAMKERRTELRKVAATRLEAEAQKAKLAIESARVDQLGLLTAGMLETSQAQDFLRQMPTAESLMQPLDVAELQALPRPER